VACIGIVGFTPAVNRGILSLKKIESIGRVRFIEDNFELAAAVRAAVHRWLSNPERYSVPILFTLFSYLTSHVGELSSSACGADSERCIYL
jgi:hypothetical protein